MHRRCLHELRIDVTQKSDAICELKQCHMWASKGKIKLGYDKLAPRGIHMFQIALERITHKKTILQTLILLVFSWSSIL